MTTPNFGAPADRLRAKLADCLEVVAGHIRRGECEYDPRGFVLLLQSDMNPAVFEVLNVGMLTTLDMERAALAVRSRIPKPL